MEAWIARQAICDASRRIVAYELLHRTADGTPGEGAQASAEVVYHMLFSVGLERIATGKPAYVNVPQQLLTDPRIRLLPPESIGLEILEDTSPTPEVLAACGELRDAGFHLLLDDYAGQRHLLPFLDYVDSVKVEWTGDWRQHEKRLFSWRARRGGVLLAEKLETIDEFQRAVDLGFDQFQGYFLERPRTMTIRRIPNNAPVRIRLLAALADSAKGLDEFIPMVKRDPELSLLVLKWVNSARFARAYPSVCVEEALAWLGETECRRWLTVLLLPELAPGMDQRLLTAMIVRARFSESIMDGRGIPDQCGHTFIVSLIAELVRLVGIEQNDLSTHYRLPNSIVKRVAHILAREQDNEEASAVMLAHSYYEGRWDICDRLCRMQGFPAEDLAERYLDALAWGSNL